MKQFKGRTFSGPEYIGLCQLRDKEKKFHEKLIHNHGVKEFNHTLLVKLPQIKKQKPGEYSHIAANSIEAIIVNVKDKAPPQTRWLECMVASKNRNWEKYYIFFEPYFFELI